MKANEIVIGKVYVAKIGVNVTQVRVDAIRNVAYVSAGGYLGWTSASREREQTRYDVTNLATGRRTTFRSAAKFRAEIKNPLPV